MGEVEPLRREPEASQPEQQPGVDVGYAFAIDEKRSLSMRTMFPQDTKPLVQERILRQIMSVSAVVSLREKLIEFRKDKANAEARLLELPDPEKRKSEIKVEIDALLAERAEKAAEFEHRFRNSGRSGAYKAVGAEKTALEAYDKDMGNLRQQAVNLDADLKRQRDELAKAIKNWDVAIANAEREIAIRQEAYGA